jgi:hypothetical protein
VIHVLTAVITAQGEFTMITADTETTTTAAAFAAQGANVAPEKASSKKNTSPKKGAPKSQKGAKGKAKASRKKGAKVGKAAKPAHTKDASAPRAESKGAKILELIGRPKGATLAEIVKDWQKHSIRGFLSTAAKKHGLKIESTKTETGDRVYQIRKYDFPVAAAARKGGGFSYCGESNPYPPLV